MCISTPWRAARQEQRLCGCCQRRDPHRVRAAQRLQLANLIILECRRIHHYPCVTCLLIMSYLPKGCKLSCAASAQVDLSGKGSGYGQCIAAAHQAGVCRRLHLRPALVQAILRAGPGNAINLAVAPPRWISHAAQSMLDSSLCLDVPS